MQPSPLSHSRRFSSPQKKPHSHAPFPPPPSPWQPLICVLPPQICLLWMTHVNEWIRRYAAYCDQFLSLSTVFSGYIHVVLCVNNSLLFWLNNTPLYACTTLCLSLHQWVDAWVVPSFGLLWRRLLWTLLHVFLFECLLSILLVIHLGVGFLGPTVTLCVTSWRAAIWLSTVPVSFYSSLRRFQFIHIFVNTCHPLFINTTILMDMKLYLIVVFFCISQPLTVLNIQHAHGTFVLFLWGNVYSSPTSV